MHLFPSSSNTVQAADGKDTCGAVAERAKDAAGMLRAALAALAEEAESHAVRQVSANLLQISSLARKQ